MILILKEVISQIIVNLNTVNIQFITYFNFGLEMLIRFSRGACYKLFYFIIYALLLSILIIYKYYY